MENKSVRPTIGFCPRNIWIYKRIQEITEALQRQNEAGEKLNKDWIQELIFCK